MQSEQASGPPAAVAPGPVAACSNLADLVAARAAERPDATALVEPGPPAGPGPRRTLSWAALDARVSAVAAGLTAQGLLAGQRLALLGPGSAAWVVAHLAALRAGVVVVPLDPQSTADETAVVLADSGARVLLSARGPGPAGVTTLPLTEDGLAALAADAALLTSPPDAESLAVLLYTAGTSGRPKAAMLTHRALLAHVEHVGRLGVLTPDDVVLATLPLFHVFGLNAVLGSWVGSGARLVVVDGYPEGIGALVRDEGVTNLPLAPPTLHRLLAEPDLDAGLGRLRTVVAGAAPLPEELAAAFTARTGLPVERGYGLTEAAPGVTATFGGTGSGPGHVGPPLPGVEVRIGDGREPGEPAEIAVRGANLFSGYWPDGSDGPDADGWFPTGDIGYLDAGELVLVDRARELVVVNGFNVYPAEVEQVIAELAEVEAVAVVGRPDPRTGEQVVAFVEGRALSADRVEAHCRQRLARFKRPSAVHVVDALPRGATGKIRKGMLREMTRAEQEQR
ncbi:class I adenylate-forming enzyme family protein [Friedmanniella luteola]|uniref:class I adenylate-forming enzyme family protein n=1 Tax=Friedmanniella luteola TaxID=546871 RepID=UPI000B82DC81|nr:AMP-binding protein [Friedmanniella luteola]